MYVCIAIEQASAVTTCVHKMLQSGLFV